MNKQQLIKSHILFRLSGSIRKGIFIGDKEYGKKLIEAKKQIRMKFLNSSKKIIKK